MKQRGGKTMNDRFRFNAIVTIEYFENAEKFENDEESEILIYLRNIDLMDANTIGYRNDELSYTLKNAGLSEYALHNAIERIEENSESAEPSEWITLVPDVILQCTGLKDKNGTLIYEGDIVKLIADTFTTTYVVKFGDFAMFSLDFQSKYEKGSTAVYGWYLDGMKYPIPLSISLDTSGLKLEVIGNIYENPELLKEVENVS